MYSVEMKHLNFAYDGNVQIFEDASFHANYGEVTLVAGHSGEGKSTLLSIASGIIPNLTYGKLEGEVIVAGDSIIGRKMDYICRKVGVVLQNADEQIVHKVVEDEVSFALENLAFKPEDMDYQINTVLKLMKLNRTDKTWTLSGGQKQRLITASTLAMGQRIIILDEPLANLDKDGANLLMTTLQKLTRSGYSVIIVEHRLDVVMPYVDKVWHIGDKKITEIENKATYLGDQTKKILDTVEVKPSGEKLFIADDLHFAVKKKEIIKGINVDIEKGSRTLILGENGCGKTTFVRLLARLYKPTSGCIHQSLNPKFKEKKKGSRKWYKAVGVVYQNPDYQLFMPTVKKELTFGAKSEEYALRMAKLFGIEHLLERHPQSLSEGQKRRVSIAAVAASEPKVLILDEPTVGQDYAGLQNLVETLNELHEETGNTMITITHDVRAAEALCDNAILIDKGQVIETGGKDLVKRYFDGVIKTN